MADYTTHEIVIVTVEYRIPVPGYWNDLSKALAAIRKEIGDDKAFYDDAVKTDVRDDCIVLSYEKSRTGG